MTIWNGYARVAAPPLFVSGRRSKHSNAPATFRPNITL
jgi:hypothetical protein